jgi:hypothetical protein
MKKHMRICAAFFAAIVLARIMQRFDGYDEADGAIA